uniref:Uncharacterized protein n=1 Tax=Rhizophagus irregularis (strain DAOM 181602 / DAOM 197198 / MUCL 43194) TaxID=747089 RepID=U9V5D3_RHIID
MQSIDSLRELNAKLLAEIAELRKENAEILRTFPFGQTQNGEEVMPVVMLPTVDVPDSIIDQLNNEASDLDGNEEMVNFLDDDVTKIPEASSESIRSASCVLSKQPQVNASKLTCNLETREDSSRLESCDMEELKSDQHDEDPSSDTAQNIVCMFKKAKKLGQEAILYWYYFIEKYDERIDNLIAGGVKKKTATSMVYQEIKQLLLEITDRRCYFKPQLPTNPKSGGGYSNEHDS